MTELSSLNDVSTFAADGTPGLQPGKRIRAVRVVLEWVARRWLSRVNSVAWDDTVRIDVGDLRNADLTATQLGELPGILEGEARLVDFVRRCSVRAALDPSGALRIGGSVEIYTAGTYPLAVTITGAKVALSFPQVRP